MTDGTLSVRRRQPKASETASSDLLPNAALKAGAFESLLGGTLPSIGQRRVRDKAKSKSVGDVDEFKVESRRKKRLRDYDKMLKNFNYTAALDAVLGKVWAPALVLPRSSLIPMLSVPTASPSNNNLFRDPRAHPS